jgi:hypothetical protein
MLQTSTATMFASWMRWSSIGQLVIPGDPTIELAALTEIKPALDALGPYPILQFFAALIIVLCFAFGGILLLKGEKFAKKEASTPLDSPRSEHAAVQLFFDGPLKAIFDVLHEIQTTQATNKLELKDVVARLLSEQRQAIAELAAARATEVKAALEDDTREKLGHLANIENQLREMRDMLVRVEAKPQHK